MFRIDFSPNAFGRSFLSFLARDHRFLIAAGASDKAGRPLRW
jgi:hypothetical protein